MLKNISIDLNELIYIFYSGYSGNYEYDKLNNLLQALKEDAINLGRLPTGTVAKYNDYLEKIYANTIKTINLNGARQNNGHFALKLIAADYLKSLNLKCKHEVKLQDRLADAAAEDLSVIIECGCTDPGKIFNYLEKPSVKQVIILPYPEPDNDNLFFYSFSRGEYFNEYSEAMETIKFSKIKQIILNRKKS